MNGEEGEEKAHEAEDEQGLLTEEGIFPGVGNDSTRGEVPQSAHVATGNSLEILKAFRDDSIDACVTDPPYGLAFMGARWDYDIPSTDLWREVFRVLKPGAHLLAFGGSRTFHRIACTIEDAGFELRDTLMWVYSTGFPKSMAIDKAIEKRKFNRAEVYEVTAWIRARRDEIGISNGVIDEAFGFSGMAGHWTSNKSQPSIPTLEQVPKLLEILRTSLDEIPERIRTLLVELNGQKYQPGPNWYKREITGEARQWETGVNFRITSRDGILRDEPATEEGKAWKGWGTCLKPAFEPIIMARKPMIGTHAENVLQFGTGALNIDACRIPGIIAGGDLDRFPSNLMHDDSEEVRWRLRDASRVFYSPKASTEDRNEGIDENGHPTVKPTDLMRWCIRLVTRKGSTVLDPFTGSGSTGKAAILEDCSFQGIELNPDYAEIARARCADVIALAKQAELFG